MTFLFARECQKVSYSVVGKIDEKIIMRFVGERSEKKIN